MSQKSDGTVVLEIRVQAVSLSPYRAGFAGLQHTTRVTLEELRQLIREINEARQQRDATELPAESFAKAAGEAFERYPHWQTSSHQEEEVRKTFYKALINAGVQGVVDVAQGIPKMLRRATP